MLGRIAGRRAACSRGASSAVARQARPQNERRILYQGVDLAHLTERKLKPYRIASGKSDSVPADIGISTGIMMFPFNIILGFRSGFQPVAGYNRGAARYDRVRTSCRFSARVAINERRGGRPGEA